MSSLAHPVREHLRMRVREGTCLFISSHSCTWKGITESLWQVLPSRASPAAEPHTAAHKNIILRRSFGSHSTKGLCGWQQRQQWKKSLTIESGSRGTVTQLVSPTHFLTLEKLQHGKPPESSHRKCYDGRLLSKPGGITPHLHCTGHC